MRLRADAKLDLCRSVWSDQVMFQASEVEQEYWPVLTHAHATGPLGRTGCHASVKPHGQRGLSLGRGQKALIIIKLFSAARVIQRQVLTWAIQNH